MRLWSLSLKNSMVAIASASATATALPREPARASLQLPGVLEPVVAGTEQGDSEPEAFGKAGLILSS